MIIDVHGHTSAPPELYSYNYSMLVNPSDGARPGPRMSDERVEQAMETHLGQLAEVGTDIQLISPRPWGIPHAVRDESLVLAMTRANNDLIARQVAMHPDVFRGVGGLPQTTGTSPANCVEELERCVTELGFLGCQINPDPAAGVEQGPPMGDEHWYPLYEKMVELDVPALVHTGSCRSPRENQSEHFITEESIAVLTLLRSNVFQDFPGLKLVISHGGGSVPYQVGRFRAGRFGQMRRNAAVERFDTSLRRLYFDTVLYNRESIELLVRIVGADRTLFGTDRPATGTVVDPDTGRTLDDLKPVIEEIEWLSDEERQRIFEGNAKELYKLE